MQLALEDGDAVPDTLVQTMKHLAQNDPSPIVRLYIAAALQRPAMLKRPALERSPILSGLLSHPEDFADHNLPLMYWYALEPLAETDPRTDAGRGRRMRRSRRCCRGRRGGVAIAVRRKRWA